MANTPRKSTPKRTTPKKPMKKDLNRFNPSTEKKAMQTATKLACVASAAFKDHLIDDLARVVSNVVESNKDGMRIIQTKQIKEAIVMASASGDQSPIVKLLEAGSLAGVAGPGLAQLMKKADAEKKAKKSTEGGKITKKGGSKKKKASSKKKPAKRTPSN